LLPGGLNRSRDWKGEISIPSRRIKVSEVSSAWNIEHHHSLQVPLALGPGNHFKFYCIPYHDNLIFFCNALFIFFLGLVLTYVKLSRGFAPCVKSLFFRKT